ncbi:uncharacterized protein LOC34619575 [Cyclospora cayetanensis]|uniref:Uncharacterized protein LOC34619575 n=1 Tax=Cyclospora cayetanensis TaxID=88456 RepID=A0A6P6RU06_9EIME|nr:uncharacterized protein LOC34619575 [Cyclospora cayetanensis]
MEKLFPLPLIDSPVSPAFPTHSDSSSVYTSSRQHTNTAACCTSSVSSGENSLTQAPDYGCPDEGKSQLAERRASRGSEERFIPLKRPRKGGLEEPACATPAPLGAVNHDEINEHRLRSPASNSRAACSVASPPSAIAVACGPALNNGQPAESTRKEESSATTTSLSEGIVPRHEGRTDEAKGVAKPHAALSAARLSRGRQKGELRRDGRGAAHEMNIFADAVLSSIQDTSWETLKALSFDSLRRAIFRCLQDLRAAGGVPSEGGPQDPGRFANHVENILDACNSEDLAPYLQIFAVCLTQGCEPHCLPMEARVLMVECLSALKATGYSVHVRRVFEEYHRLVSTLRRRDVLLAPLSNDSIAGVGRWGSSCCALRQVAAAAGPEDGQLADLWVSASRWNQTPEEAQESDFQGSVCRSSGRPEDFLLHCKGVILKQLRYLRRIAPVWAARDRSYQYHMEAVLGAKTPSELARYLLILSSLQPDPDGKHIVSVGSLHDCLRELHLLQRTDSQEGLTGALPVTHAELAQCLAAVQSKRNLEGGLSGPLMTLGRKHGARTVSALPAPSTRAQKYRLVSPQLEAEVTANLQRLSSLPCGDPFLTAFGAPRAKARGEDPSLMYAEELMAVAAGAADPPTVAQQWAFTELQRLRQYWAEGMFPLATREEASLPPLAPPSTPVSLYSAPGRLGFAWRMPRTRSTPCPISTARGTNASCSGHHFPSATHCRNGEASSRASFQRLSPPRAALQSSGTRGFISQAS